MLSPSSTPLKSVALLGLSETSKLSKPLSRNYSLKRVMQRPATPSSRASVQSWARPQGKAVPVANTTMTDRQHGQDLHTTGKDGFLKARAVTTQAVTRTSRTRIRRRVQNATLPSKKPKRTSVRMSLKDFVHLRLLTSRALIERSRVS